MSDLFSAAHADAMNARAPLAVRLRPQSIDEVVGQSHLLQAGSPLRTLASGDSQSQQGNSVILWGPPGTGKTTLAHVIAASSDRIFVELSAITAGVKDVRQVMDEALRQRDLYQRSTVLFLDEIHRFTKAQQDALLPGVENGWVILVAATTENPSFSVISPLLSRSLLLTLQPLGSTDLRTLMTRALDDERGLAGKFSIAKDAAEHLIKLAGSDGRRILTTLEAASSMASSRTAASADAVEAEGDAVQSQLIQISLDDAEQAIDVAAQRYDRNADMHYDVTSALIKSIRGSDVDAALHYLARMIQAGEDPRFIARRLMISASEDIGMADPTALATAVAAAQGVALIGMPEGRILLAQAVTHLATAPKSNASYQGLEKASADVRAGKGQGVPAHLRDAHYPGAKALGHGKNYHYAHNSAHGVVPQQYPPDDLVNVDYYQPTENGAEKGIKQRLEKLRQIVASRR